MKNFVGRVTVLTVVCSLSVLAPAYAGTYRMSIEGGDDVLKAYVDGGTVKRKGTEGTAAIFEVTMEGNKCSASVKLAFQNEAPPLVVPYDVCSEEGFGITMEVVQN